MIEHFERCIFGKSTSELASNYKVSVRTPWSARYRIMLHMKDTYMWGPTDHQASTASRNNLAICNTPLLSTLAGDSSRRVPALGRLPCPWSRQASFRAPTLAGPTWPYKASRPPPHSGSANRCQSTQYRVPALTLPGTSRFPPTDPGAFPRILQEANNQNGNRPSPSQSCPVRFPSFFAQHPGNSPDLAASLVAN